MLAPLFCYLLPYTCTGMRLCGSSSLRGYGYGVSWRQYGQDQWRGGLAGNEMRKMML